MPAGYFVYASVSRLFEEQTAEGVEVQAPVLPHVGVVAHEEGVLHTVVGEVLVKDEGAVVCSGVLLADADPVKLVAGLLDTLELWPVDYARFLACVYFLYCAGLHCAFRGTKNGLARFRAC